MTTFPTFSARRRWLQGALALAAAATCLGAQAQGAGDYPNKPIKIIVTYAPGGLTDSMARVLAEKMGRQAEAVAFFKEIYAVDIKYRDISQRIEAAYQKK